MEFKNREEDSVKIKYFLKYFNEKMDKIEKEKKYYDRARKLEKMIKIYESDENDIIKLAKMHQLYMVADDFVCQFSDLERYNDDKKIEYFAKKAKEIGDYFKASEEKGLVKESSVLMKLDENGYFADYAYAYGFVSDFINYQESPYLNDFLEECGLNRGSFNRFVDIIRILNMDLYDKYIEKYNSNIELRKQDVIRKIDNLYEGAKNGKLGDNTPFDPVEYFVNLPFYDEETSKEIFKDFNITMTPQINGRFRALLYFFDKEKADVILNYTNRHNLYFASYPTPLTKNYIMKANYIVDGYTLTDEDKKIIIDYMNKRKIPLLTKSYIEVRNKYLKEGLEDKQLSLRK